METRHDMGGHLLHDAKLLVLFVNEDYMFHFNYIILTTDFTDFKDSLLRIWQLKLLIGTDGVGSVNKTFEC